jgi:peroxiredoxin
MDLPAVALGLTWLVLAPCIWLGYQLMVQNGRIVLRLEALEQGAPLGPPNDDELDAGLPVGSVLLDFELPLLTGGMDRFSAWRDKQVLLIFVDPSCPFSRALIDDLSQLPAGEPSPLIVSTGSPEQNRELFEPDEMRLPVFLQEGFEVAVLASAPATPSGYLVDRVGRTESPLALGLHELRRLAGLVTPGRQEPAGAAGADFTIHAGDPVFASYGEELHGLPVGTPAPAVRLTRLGGGEFSIEDYRGRPVLLVFVDPERAASQALLPELAALARRSPASAVVVVSRGDPASNEAWAQQCGGDLQIGLQRYWEASRAFHLVAIPVAFLLDEHGTIAAEPAIGMDAILALAGGPPARMATPARIA